MSQFVARLRDRMSEDQLVRLATEVLGDKPREVARDVFGAIHDDPGDELITNALALFRELATRSPAWVYILERSIRKRGRCPKPLVATLRGLLSTERDSLAREVRSVRELLADLETVADPIVDQRTTQREVSGVQIKRTTTFFRSGRLRATVPITQELSDIIRMDGIASLVSEIPPSTDEVVFDFSGVDHVYVVGLAALAAWCTKAGVTPEIENASDRTQRYLDLIGFTKASKGGISPYTETDPTFAMAIEKISAHSEPERIAGKLATIIDSQMNLSAAARQGLIVVFAELVENIQRHAGLSSPAYACAQAYPKRRKLTICVVDTGIGIRESIRTSSNEALVRRVEEGESPVQLACAPLVTSKPEKHSGYGLYVASELVVRNGGTFRIFSGSEIYTRYRRRWQKRENLTRVPDPWNGTWVAMILDLDATISVGDVYVTLPPMPGAEMEDFF
jgi:anti-sigma regulatory factor (Ser/Thr protein kinase)